VEYAETVICPGVAPDDGLTVIHEPPYTSAVKVIGLPVLLVTPIFFGDGAEEPSM
jgi:hypothetical protein